MKNVDIARETFDPRMDYSSVVKQQGRVELEADWNEQVAITLHMLRTMMTDLVGPHAGPKGHCGFRVLVNDGSARTGLDGDTQRLRQQCGPGDFVLRRGRYYVDGLACECRHPFLFTEQPYHRQDPLPPSAKHCYLVYLDAWEREVTALQDERLREIALCGADTAARTQVVWAVRAVELSKDGGHNQGPAAMSPEWPVLLDQFQPLHRGAMRARTRPAEDEPKIDATGSEAGTYRGLENQLYRIEIHRGGKASPGLATFKWSRENGNVAFPVDQVVYDTPHTVVCTLAAMGRDDASALEVGNWVEFDDFGEPHHGLTGTLLRVSELDTANRVVRLVRPVHLDRPVPELVRIECGDGRPVVLRRWDQVGGEMRRGRTPLVDGAVPLEEGLWIDIEDGIQMQFAPSDADRAHHYRSGDYWLVPARVATADVEWPRHDDEAEARTPRGVRHHYAPLAMVDVTDQHTLLLGSMVRQFGYAPLPGFGMVLTREGD